MPRENAARAWTPGDAVVFSPDGRASTSGECTSSTSTSSTKTRQPLAAMKHAKQSRKLSEEDVNRPKQHQSTLSPWAKAAWKPGMRVLIATSSKQSTESMIEKDSIKVSQSGKGKERALDSELFAKDKTDTNPARKTARLHQQEHVPFQSYNIYEDPSPSRPPQCKKAYDTTEDSLSSIKAILSENSQIDPDSSVEYLGQRGSPRTNALRHLALAEANFLEASKYTTSTGFTKMEQEYGSTVLPSTTHGPYRRRRINFVKSPSPERKSFSSTSYNPDKSSSYPTTVDWDDPVLNPAAPDTNEAASHAVESAADSDSSDLPELKFPLRGKTTIPAEKGRPAPQQNSNTEPTASSKTLPAILPATKSRPRVETAKVKQLKSAGRRYAREDKEARERKKEIEQEELKKKYRVFSYDTTTSPTPKIWYFRGLASGTVKYMGCDTRQGYVTDQPRDLEGLITELKGPLGWDLEWEMWSWNDNFSSKEQGKVALIQLGDRNNIVLFQIERGANIPECILNVIEDPAIIKLGVQIRGDAQKIGRDYTWPDGKPILPKGLLDLSHFARHVHPQEVAQHGSHIISLQRLVAMYLDSYLEKGEVRTSKWESQHLNAQQRKYAANDIFASVQVYQRVLGHAETEGIHIDFETLLLDFSARLDPQTGQVRDIVNKLRKAKPVPVRKSSANDAPRTTSEVPRATGTILSPRVYEAWETWSLHGLDREEVAQKMNVKEATVASYIIKALTTDPELAYDVDRLRALLKGIIIPNFQKPLVNQLLHQSSTPAEADDSMF